MYLAMALEPKAFLLEDRGWWPCQIDSRIKQGSVWLHMWVIAQMHLNYIKHDQPFMSTEGVFACQINKSHYQCHIGVRINKTEHVGSLPHFYNQKRI